MKKFKKSEDHLSIDNKGHLASLQQSEIWDQACTSLDHVTENGEWSHNWLTGPITGKSLLFEVLEFLVAPCQVTCRQVWIFHGSTQYFVANRWELEAERLLTQNVPTTTKFVVHVICIIYERSGIRSAIAEASSSTSDVAGDACIAVVTCTSWWKLTIFSWEH